MSESKLLSAWRPIVPGEHQKMREYMPKMNHAFPDENIKWRKLGAAGITLIERGKFQRAISKQKSLLAQVDVETLALNIQDKILPKKPTETKKLDLKVEGIDYSGKGKYLGISMILEDTELTEEQKRLTQLIDRMNGVNNYWGEFKPHLTIATIHYSDASNEILKAFENISPDLVGLLPVKVDAT